jgi:hypothetical protein
MESMLKTGKGEKPVFRLENGDAKFVVVKELEGSYGDARLYFEQASTRPWVLCSMIPRGEFYRASVKQPKLFLEDVCPGTCHFGDAVVFARQLNPENMGTKITLDGGRFWRLGLKTERAGIVMEVKNGAQAEVLGGYVYRNRGKQLTDKTAPDAFYNFNSHLSVVGISGDASVQETQNAETKIGTAKGLYVGRSPLPEGRR